jgi:hypothetical protein
VIIMYDQTGILTPEQQRAAMASNMPMMTPVDDPYANIARPPAPGDTGQIPGYSPSSYDNDDPLVAQRHHDAAMRMALAQGLSGFHDPNAPPIPQEYQQKIDQIKSMINPGPIERDYINQVQGAYNAPPVHGLRARLAGLGKGLLLGEGIAGMVRGASDPTNMNLRYKLAQMSPLAQGAQMEQQFRNATLMRNKELAESAGIDPITGLETPMSAYRNAQAYYTAGRPERENRKLDLAEQKGDAYGDWLRARVTDIQNKPLAEQKKSIAGMINSGALRTPEALSWAANMLNIPVGLRPKFQAGTIKVDENFNYIDVTTGERFQSDGNPIISSQKKVEENKTANVKIAAGGRTTPAERAEDRAVRKGHLTLAQQEGQRKIEASSRKQAESENPLPPFASAAQIAERNTKVEARTQELMQKHSTSSAPAGLQEGEKIIRRQQSPSTGEIWLTIQKPDGTTYSVKQ